VPPDGSRNLLGLQIEDWLGIEFCRYFPWSQLSLNYRETADTWDKTSDDWPPQENEPDNFLKPPQENRHRVPRSKKSPPFSLFK
jgi:hypothetical protein